MAKPSLRRPEFYPYINSGAFSVGVVPTSSIQGDRLWCQGREAALSQGGQELQEDPGWNAFGTREDSIPEFKRRHDPALKALRASRIVQL